MSTTQRWVTLAAVAIAFALYAGLAWLHFGVLAGITGGLAAPDTRFFGYGPDEMKAWIDALGRDGRIVFLNLHTFGLDLVFPPAFAFAGAAVTLAAGRGLAGFQRWPALLRLALALIAPVAYLVCDWSENLAVARLVADPMAITAATVAAASAWTRGKAALIVAMVAVPAALALARRWSAG